MNPFDDLYVGCSENEIKVLKNLMKKAKSESVKKLLQTHIDNIQTQENCFMQVMEISKILPNTDLMKIRRFLAFCNGNQQEALNLLLTQTDLEPRQNNQQIDDAQKDLIKEENLFLKRTATLEKLKKTGILIGDVIGNKFAKEKSLMQKSMKEIERQRNLKFYCKGEKQLIRNKKFKIFKWDLSNEYYGRPSDFHFRIPESQFYRQINQYNYNTYNNQYNNNINGSYPPNTRVLKVEYVVNPKLMKNFEKKKKELANKYGWLESSMKSLVLFHGTTLTNMDNILKTNFLRSKIGSKTDMGYFGKGFYFSENPNLSLGYAGCKNLLVCLVLLGKAYKQTQVITGCAKQEGYDSHVSGDGSEVVIFDPEQILPCYRITLN